MDDVVGVFGSLDHGLLVADISLDVMDLGFVFVVGEFVAV